ncbi:MAG: carbon-nitrogen hydrolase family protein [Gammaproteobacteria bacterium]|nr:carbon-nitrogen hydrolase family protein [Gammaproteobacteria bacterium]
MTKLAVIQMNSASAVDENLAVANALLIEASQAGAAVVVLPENFCLMPANDADRLAAAENDSSGPIQEFLSNTARELGIFIIAGTIPIRSSVKNKVRSACLVYNNDGERIVRYDKIHLFNVELKNGESYSESDNFDAGNDLKIVDTPVGRVGLTICYDMRFPEMYRRLLEMGAELFVVPSAFTATTGRAHWELLLRSRAVENLAFVAAPAQVGEHANGRSTYGDSMIIDPWGNILARREQADAGVVVADIDLAQMRKTRERFPVLSHRRIGTGGKHTVTKD